MAAPAASIGRPLAILCTVPDPYYIHTCYGDAEKAGLENADWKTWDQITGVKNAELENVGPSYRG